MKKILIQAGDHLENIKRILPLAMHLKENGHQPIILLYNNSDASKIFINNGIQVIFYNDYIKKLIYYKFTFIKNINLKYRKVLLKDFYIMEIKKYPYLFKKNKILYRIKKMKQTIDALIKIINIYEFDYIFVWNGYTGNVANGLRIVAKIFNIKTFFLERSLWKGGVFIDPDGTNGDSSIAKLKRIPIVEIKKQISFNSKESILKKINNNTIVFIPFQVENDTNIHLYSNEIKKMKELVKIVVESIDNNCIIIARPHPEEEESVNYNINYKNVILTSDGTIDEWISISDIVVTINSTVGLEAILKGKKVITFGKSIYSNKGLAIDASVKSFKEDIKKLKIFKINKYKIENYYNFLYLNNTVTDDNFPIVLNEFRIKKDYELKYFNKYKHLENMYFKTIYIFLDINNIYVNLTYRKNHILIDKKYIIDGINTYLNNLKVTHNEISIRSIKSKPIEKKDSLFIMITDKYQIMYDDYDIILNKYFMEV